MYTVKRRADMERTRSPGPGQWMNLNNEYKNHETQLPGKIHLSHNCLYIGFDEKEYAFKE